MYAIPCATCLSNLICLELSALSCVLEGQTQSRNWPGVVKCPRPERSVHTDRGKETPVPTTYSPTAMFMTLAGSRHLPEQQPLAAVTFSTSVLDAFGSILGRKTSRQIESLRNVVLGCVRLCAGVLTLCRTCCRHQVFINDDELLLAPRNMLLCSSQSPKQLRKVQQNNIYKHQMMIHIGRNRNYV